MSAYTQAQLDALEAAIAQGARVVRYADKSIEYRSIEEMLKIRDMMRASLGVAASSRGGRVYPTFSKGMS